MAVSSTSADQAAQIALINGQKPGQGAAQSTDKVAEMQDRFLKLLVAQLQNQDPMNPMENAEMTSQLAQMSTVEGISKMNATMETLLQGYQSSQTLQAASLVGRMVLAEGDTIELHNAVGAGAIDLKGPADSVKIKVLDDYGNVVRSMELGPQKAGLVEFGWDGKNDSGQVVADGDYWYVAEATSKGEDVEATSYALTGVRSVVIDNGVLELDTTGLGALSMSQVRQIF